MKYSEQLAIREAVSNGDADLLERTVRGMGKFADYDEILNVVGDIPGGWRHIDVMGDIHVGHVVVRDHFGSPRVVRS